MPRVAGFFGAGALSLVAMLCLASRLAARADAGARFTGTGCGPCGGWAGATRRTGRREACSASRSSPSRRSSSSRSKRSSATTRTRSLDRHSGGGGYPLLVESLLPIVHDLNDAAGRDAMNLPAGGALQGVRFDRFRVRPGDDTSCLNLYQPKNPRILGGDAGLHQQRAGSRFTVRWPRSPEERANPWLLLNREFDGRRDSGHHRRELDDLRAAHEARRRFRAAGFVGASSRLRLVAALSDSIFQGELLMAEQPFVRLFPEWEGYRFFLADAPLGQTAELTELLESRLSDFGVDVASTAERLAGFHRVEYTYLSTFQMLGGLGLVLGTLGLGAILLRNVLERRRELALLRALGYTQSDFLTMVVAENVLLLVGGLIVGTSARCVAIAPMFLDRGGRLPVATLALLLLGVSGNGTAGVARRDRRRPSIAVVVGVA